VTRKRARCSMTDLRTAFRRLSADEALHALYIDFEGEKDKPPVILGVHRRGRGARPFVYVDVVDETFASLAASSRSLHDAVATVVRRAERRDRRIVSWTEYDLKVVRTLRDEDPELVARFEARYVNALSVAKHWRNKLHGGAKPARGHLADYLPLISYSVPEDAAGGQVGETIRVVRRRLERGLPLNAAQRSRWERLVEHNRHDCAGMRQVCLRATRELEARTSPRSAGISTVGP
jgi:hypothetical protein